MKMSKKYEALLLAGVLTALSGNAFADNGFWNPTEDADDIVDGENYYVNFVGRNDGHSLTLTADGTISIKSDGYPAIESWNGSTVNLGTSEKWLTELSANTASNHWVGFASLDNGKTGNGGTLNLYAHTIKISGKSGGFNVAKGGTLNINADTFTSETKNTSQDVKDAGIQNIKAHTTINAKEVNIKSDGGVAIRVQNNTEEETPPKDTSSVTVIADTINLTGTTNAVEVYSNGQLTLSGDTTINGNVDVRGNSVTNINTDGRHTTVLNGDIVFETPNTVEDAKNSGNLINATVNLNLTGEDSSWTGSAYQQFGKENYGTGLSGNDDYYGDVTNLNVNLSDGAVWNMTKNSFVNHTTVSDGGSINISEDVETVNAGDMTASNGGTIKLNGNSTNTTLNVETLALNDGVVDLNGANNVVNVGTLSGEGTVSTNSLESSVSVAKKDNATITVKGSKEITDKIASGEATLQDLAAVVSDEDTDNDSIADKVVTDANDINGGYSADIKGDGKVDASTVVEHENTTNRAVSDMASISLMTWRQENNDMNKRLGELRDSQGQHGAWVRMARGESKYGAQNVKNRYNYYQAGYDQKVGSDWTVGVALSRTEGKSTFAAGNGENKHTGFALYGSHLADNGSFIDIIAKYARMDHDYVTSGAGVGNADYDTNGYSFSAEYGKRFTKKSGLWIEPQVELTYGKVTSADYLTSKGAHVYQDSMDSFVSRFGFALGQNFKKGNAYIRASYLYDFEGKTDVTMEKQGAGSYKFEQDLGGGWWEVGIGANINFTDTTHLYVDIEKTYGGTVATPWQWNLGVRFSF